MNIGVFSNLYPPYERGGAELIAQRIADELARRGHHVFVLSTMPFSGLKSLKPQTVAVHVERIYRFFPLNLFHLSHASHYPFPVRFLWHMVDLIGPLYASAVERLLDHEEPDVILTHNLKGLGVSAARCVQRMGIRHIHTLHDVQLSVPSGLLLFGEEDTWIHTGPLRTWYEHLAKKALGSPDAVISPSKFLANFYLERGFFEQTPMYIMPNPAPKFFQKLSIHQQPSNKLRLLFVGQLEPHKGIHVLLEAMDSLQVPFELHIAGDGSLATEVFRRAKRDHRIFYHGFISLEHIHQLMLHSDAVVLPSLCYENSPTVVYESLQAGVPVIASRIGGIPELVQDGVNGLLVEPGNAEAFVAAFERFIEQRDAFCTRREDIYRGAHAYALETYIDQLEILLGSLPKPGCA